MSNTNPQQNNINSTNVNITHAFNVRTLHIFIFKITVFLFLSVMLLLMLTYFYARKQWKTYTKRDLWMIFLVDVVIAALYNYDIYIEPAEAYTDYLLIEIWIRPTITYGLVACFVTEVEEESLTDH